MDKGGIMDKKQLLDKVRLLDKNVTKMVKNKSKQHKKLNNMINRLIKLDLKYHTLYGTHVVKEWRGMDD